MRFLFLFAALVVLASCTPSLDATKGAAASTAASINGEFVAIRAAQERLVSELTVLYEHRSDVSIHGMDADQGGLYATFPGNKYYYKNRPSVSALYLSPLGPVTDAMRRQVKFLETLEPPLERSLASSDVLTVSFYGVVRPTDAALLVPWTDVVSTLPPGIHLNLFEWYRRGLESTGPSVWSAAPFADLNTGWVMDVAAPVLASGDDHGVSVISVNLAKLAAKYLGSQTLALALVGSDSTVVGLTPAAEVLLGVKALETPDYLRQQKENSFVPGRFKLGDASQSALARSVAEGLAEGKSSLEIKADRVLTVVAAPVPETKMAVVGLVPR